jgi:hypothetical protein
VDASWKAQARRTAAALALLGLASLAPPVVAGPTPEEYLARVGERAKLVPSGKLELDGYKAECGRRSHPASRRARSAGATAG